MRIGFDSPGAGRYRNVPRETCRWLVTGLVRVVWIPRCLRHRLGSLFDERVAMFHVEHVLDAAKSRCLRVRKSYRQVGNFTPDSTPIVGKCQHPTHVPLGRRIWIPAPLVRRGATTRSVEGSTWNMCLPENCRAQQNAAADSASQPVPRETSQQNTGRCRHIQPVP